MGIWRIEHHNVVTSTQALMRARLDAGEDVDRLVIRATAQREGRGRHGRRWESEVGGSYQTAALRDEAATLQKPCTTLALALGIAQCLNAREAVKLKWPNDLFLGGGKVGGVLAEYCQGHLLVGVGVNVDNVTPPGAQRLRAFSLEEVHEAVLAGLELGLEYLATPRQLRLRYRRYDYLYGKTLRLLENGRTWQGVALGIDEEACLRLVFPKGTRRSFCTGQVVSWESDDPI